MEENKDIELRSDSVQEILSRPPRWIISWGITVILLLVAILFVGSYFIKYPDIVSSAIEVSTKNLPANLVAKTSGKIDTLFVGENDAVEEGQYVAVIENPANFNDVVQLSNYISQYKSYFNDFQDSFAFVAPLRGLSLGELQSHYYQFVKALQDYQYFVESDFHTKKINTLNKQLLIQKKVANSVESQCKITRNQLLSQRKLFSIDSNLFAKKVISMVEYEAASNSLSQAESYENALSSINSALLNISQLEQNILDLQQQADEQRKQLQIAFSGSYENIQSQLNQWEQTYVFKSPLQGTVAMTKFWQRNQNISAGEILLSIIPEMDAMIIGKVMLPAQGAGKVKVGQDVNIKFDGFPYMEYGMVRATVSSISLVPVSNEKGKFLVVEIELPNKLTTNYGKELDFSQEMSGTAEIITEDLRLLDRFINPIKSIIKR
jgi:HlyD family secretion protein